MPLRAAEAPAEAVERLNGAIVDAIRAPGLLRRVLNKDFAGRPGLAAPHRLHGLSLDEVARGPDLSSTAPTLLRLVVLEGSDPIAIAELATGPDGTVGGFRGFIRGQSVRGTVEGIEVAEGLPAVQAGSFELRAVGVPALHIQALWLKDDGGGDDIVIPIAPVPPPLVAGQPVPPVEFFSPLQEIARQRLAVTDRVEA